MRRIRARIAAELAPSKARILELVQAIDPDFRLSNLIAAMKDDGVLFDLDTNCAEALVRLEQIQEFASGAEALGLSYHFQMIERHPGVRTAQWKAISPQDLYETAEYERRIAFTGLPDAVLKHIDDLESADWIANLGKPINSTTAVLTEGSHAPQRNWLSVVGESASQLTIELSQRHPYLYSRTYNVVAKSINLGLLVTDKIQDFNQEVRDRDSLISGLNRIVTQSCMEIYFQAVVEVSTAQAMSQWLLKGHLPCGKEESGEERLMLL